MFSELEKYDTNVIKKLSVSTTHIYSTKHFIHKPFNAGIKSLGATLPDESFYFGFCFLNRAFR
jgi:hypothetical protein